MVNIEKKKKQALEFKCYMKVKFYTDLKSDFQQAFQ